MKRKNILEIVSEKDIGRVKIKQTSKEVGNR